MRKPNTFGNPIFDLIHVLTAKISTLALLAAPIVLRVALALPFFKSGLTRWDGFLNISGGTVYLFENEFKLHILGGEYGFPVPIVAAYLTSMAEIMLPILLVLGFGTRFVALALLIMTATIELVFPEGWATYHLPWAAMALAVMALGAGPLSLDNMLVSRFAGRRTDAAVAASY